MDNPKSTRRFPLRSMLLHLSVDGALTAAVLLAAYVGREVTRQVVDSGWLATFAGQLEKLVFLAVITSFSVKAFSEISFDIYSSLKKGLSNAWFRTVQFRWTVGREVFSHA